jgi:hypothetical protein
MSQRFRVLACDQDPSVSGAIGHLLGVAFGTPALFDRRTHSVSVEILGEFTTASPLMAPLQSERFAASAYSRRPFAPRPAVVVTLSGIGEPLRDSVAKLDVPVVCLSELSMAATSENMGIDRFTCQLDHACSDCVTREFGRTVDSMRLAELCKQFALIFTRDFGQEGS